MSRLGTHLLAPLGLQTDIRGLSLAQRVRISQWPLLLTVGLLCIVYAALLPGVLDRPAFQAGVVLLLLITAAASVIPWDRLWYPSYWLVPLLDFVAIGLLHFGSQGLAMGIYLLAVFPVFWLAWSRVSSAAALVLSFLGPLVIVWYPVFVSGQPITGQRLAAPILGPLVTVAAAITVTVLRRDMDRRQAALAHKDQLLEDALEESTERSQLLDVVLNAIDVGVLVVGPNGSAVHKNQRMKILDDRLRPPGIAHTQEEDLLFFGSDRTTALTPEQRPVGRAMKGEPFQDVLIWAGRPGDMMALSCSARILRNENGFNGAVIAFSDITALADALRARDDFVSNVSHELRTPLTSIIGYLELAQDEVKDIGLTGTISHAVDVAQRNSERLLSLVSDLLAAASGSVALDPRPVSAGELISSSLRSASPRAAAGQVSLAAEHAPGLMLQADPGRLAQVLDNLLSNAIKYSPEGGTVTVRAWLESGSGSRPTTAYLQVQDTGMGMDDDDQRELFTKFFRTGAVRRAGIPGAGLGLAITKNIVEAHGGTISLLSAQGKGSTFTVSLPQAAKLPAETVPQDASA